MSKLADAIRRTMRAEAAPMGFGAARTSPKATMLVGVLANSNSLAKAQGADLVIIDRRGGRVSASDISKAGEATQAIVGLRARDADRASLAEMRKAGLDFLIFDADSTPASALLEEDLGYVLALPDKPEESLLRSLEPLSLDAFYVDDLPSPLTVGRELELMRVGVFGRRPVMGRVKPDVDKGELECLRAAGVAVLLLEDPAAVEALKETVLSLPPRRPRREERPAVAIPRAAVQLEPEHEHEDDDDDD